MFKSIRKQEKQTFLKIRISSFERGAQGWMRAELEPSDLITLSGCQVLQLEPHFTAQLQYCTEPPDLELDNGTLGKREGFGVIY